MTRTPEAPDRGPRERGLVVAGLVVLVALLALTGHLAVTAGRPVAHAAAAPVTTTAADSPAAPLLFVPVGAERRPGRSPRAQHLDVDRGWVDAVHVTTGIDPTAVRAYGLAALRLSREQPGCRLGWPTLAAIGAVESAHGTTGGVRLLPGGSTTRPIIGPALDGGEFAAIPAPSESVRRHGDPRWDHAVGPLQFIGSTWARWRSDGNGDGSADPGNIFDASYAAARYLCASGADLATGEGWSRSVHSYNHSAAYVAQVRALADQYAARAAERTMR